MIRDVGCMSKSNVRFEGRSKAICRSSVLRNVGKIVSEFHVDYVFDEN